MSQAEEDAWNSMAPTLASMMLPNSPEASKWRKVGMSYALGSYTRRSDLGRKVLIDGGRIGATAKGYNLNSNGTMVNHGRVHPEYMSLITMKTDMGGADADIDVTTSVRGLIKVIGRAKPQDTGLYFDYTGKKLKW